MKNKAIPSTINQIPINKARYKGFHAYAASIMYNIPSITPKAPEPFPIVPYLANKDIIPDIMRKNPAM